MTTAEQKVEFTFQAKSIGDLFLLPLPTTEHAILEHISAILRIDAGYYAQPFSGVPTDEQWAAATDADRLKWSPMRYAKLAAWWPLAHYIAQHIDTKEDFDRAFAYADAITAGITYDDASLPFDEEHYDSIADAVDAIWADAFNGGYFSCGPENAYGIKAKLITLGWWEQGRKEDFESDEASFNGVGAE